MIQTSFHVPAGHLYVFSGKMSIQNFCPFLNQNVFYHYQVVWVLYIFSVLTPYMICKHLFHSANYLCVFFVVVVVVDDFLCCAEAFWFDVVPFNFAFVSFAWGDISKKILLRPMLKSILCFLLGVLCFRSYIQVFNPFWVDFCLWYNILV